MSVSGAHAGYRFVQELAAGGMGRIELVVRREGTFARAYARKRLLPGAVTDGAVRAMLLEEARVAGLVRHANVVPVLDLGEDEEGPFLVMELVDGVSLLALIERLGAQLPAQVCVEIARQIAEGIHAAHETVSPDGAAMGVVHRDLTPSNVLVGFDGTVRVTDFGVAKARDRASTTRAGAPRGKRSYMAPEQLRDEDVDRRTDLFALGVVLAEMLRGGPLHGDATAAEISRRTLEEPPPDPGEERDDLPPELVALLFELMARSPADRPRDARVVAMRLGAIHAGLRAEEGPIDLGELVRARCDDVRRANQRLLADALRDQDPTLAEIALPEARSPIEPPSLSLSLAEAPPTVLDEPSDVPPADHEASAQRPARPVASWLGVGGAIASVLALIVAVSALWAATRGGERASTEREPDAILVPSTAAGERATVEHAPPPDDPMAELGAPPGEPSPVDAPADTTDEAPGLDTDGSSARGTKAPSARRGRAQSKRSTRERDRMRREERSGTIPSWAWD